MRRSIITSFIALLALQAFGSATWTLNNKKYQVDTLFHAQIGPGTTMTSLKLEGPVKFRIFYTTTDLKNKNVDVRAIKHTDRLAGVSTISEAMKSHSNDHRRYFAGINADFFSKSSPCGITVVDNEVYGSTQSSGWYLFGMNANRIPMIGTGELAITVTSASGKNFSCHKLNRPRTANDLVVYTPRFGGSTGTDADGTEVLIKPIDNNNNLTPGTQVTMKIVSAPVVGTGNAAIPSGSYILSGNGLAATFLNDLKTGDEVKMRCAIRFNGITGGKVVQALGGCPAILSDGKVLDTDKVLDHLSSAQPRTAVGFNAARDTLVMLVADGRSAISVGPISKVLAGMMKCAGCSEALNFDGGGSTELYTDKFGIVNVPSDGGERKVTDGLYLSTDTPQDNVVASIGFKDYAKKLAIGEIYRPVIYGYNQYGVLIDTDLKDVRLSTPDGVTFSSAEAGCYPLTASYGNISVSIAVTVDGSGSVGDITADTPLSCYPNPVRQGEYVYISAEDESVSSVRIYDINGRILSSQVHTGDNGKVAISTAALPRGIYLLETFFNNNRNNKLVKLIVY